MPRSLGCGRGKSEILLEPIGGITISILFAGGWACSPVFPGSRSLAYLIAGFFIGPFGIGPVKSRGSIGVTSERSLEGERAVLSRLDSSTYKLLSCAIATANAARRRAMNPAIRIAATRSQTVIAIGLSK